MHRVSQADLAESPPKPQRDRALPNAKHGLGKASIEDRQDFELSMEVCAPAGMRALAMGRQYASLLSGQLESQRAYFTERQHRAAAGHAAAVSPHSHPCVLTGGRCAIVRRCWRSDARRPRRWRPSFRLSPMPQRHCRPSSTGFVLLEPTVTQQFAAGEGAVRAGADAAARAARGACPSGRSAGAQRAGVCRAAGAAQERAGAAGQGARHVSLCRQPPLRRSWMRCGRAATTCWGTCTTRGASAAAAPRRRAASLATGPHAPQDLEQASIVMVPRSPESPRRGRGRGKR